MRAARLKMVELLEQRGIHDSAVLNAFRKVRREDFVDPGLREFAYEDHPLPIAEEQTISQPYIVALMAEALELRATDRVLEVGTGSGYAAAILGEIAAEVYTVERYPSLARTASERLRGYPNVHVRCGDGTQGWVEHAPYDGIVVAAGGPTVPEELKRQLQVGGRLLIPVGPTRDQKLTLVRRLSDSDYSESDLGAVRFVPLVGKEGWPERLQDGSLSDQIRQEAEVFTSIDRYHPEAWLRRVGDARVVLLGEASHGTSEFYRMRARLTRALVEQKGFNIVAVEADWPDGRLLDDFASGRADDLNSWHSQSRFPHWMWRNQEMVDFITWLRRHNETHTGKVGFYGLDLYSLQASIRKVLDFLDVHHPEAAQLARHRYACLTPWQADPAAYGRAVLTNLYKKCEPAVVERLLAAMPRQNGQDEHLDALMNSRVVKNAEEYYRVMYYGSAESWNLRDQHMFDVLEHLLRRDPKARAVVWEHNSHLGDARATEMSMRGEHNLGQLARQAWSVYSVGFGTHTGEVACATHWDGEMEIKKVVPSHARSFERLFHNTGLARFSLPLRQASPGLRKQLSFPRLERAIGVIYRPESELASHYFHADLSRQFDEYIWFDETRAVAALPSPVRQR